MLLRPFVCFMDNVDARALLNAAEACCASGCEKFRGHGDKHCHYRVPLFVVATSLSQSVACNIPFCGHILVLLVVLMLWTQGDEGVCL